MSEMHAMAKVARQLVIQIGRHLESGNFGINHNFGENGENGTNGKNRQGVDKRQNVANIQTGYQKWPLEEW